MSTRYTKPQTEEEKEAMATRKKAEKSESKERAAVGRERRLALALVAVLDAAAESSETEAARLLLQEFGYSGIESTPKRIARIHEELKAAIEAGDGARIAELGKELDLAKAGKFHRVKEQAVVGSE